MKILVSILLVLGVIFVGWKMWEYWEEVNTEKTKQERAANREIDPSRLEGLDQRYERSLMDAKDKGAANLKAWIEQAKANGFLTDPRLAWVELDYVVMVALENPVEAKKVFASVRSRVPEDSPVFKRLQTMASTFE